MVLRCSVSNSNGEIYTRKVDFSSLAHMSFKLQRRNLHQATQAARGAWIRFQTPTEKFTHRIEPRNIKSLTVSNSNGEIYTDHSKRLYSHRQVSNSNGEIYTRLRSARFVRRGCFKLQRRNLHTSAVLVLTVALVSNSSGENLHSVRNSIFSGYEYWSLYSYPLNLDKRQRLFKVKHRICGVLQISAKALSAYLQSFNQNRSRDLTAQKSLPFCRAVISPRTI